MFLGQLFEAKFPIIQPGSPSKVDPALMTFSEYLKIVDEKNKRHDSDAYDVDLDDLNRTYQNSQPYTKDKFPHLIQRVKLNGLFFEFRVQAEELRYYHRDEAGEYVRDANNDLVPLTKEEIKESGRETHEFNISAFDEDGQRVCALQDEWGCVLVMVAREYRGFGLGAILTKLALKFYPDKPTGGFTPQGYKNYWNAYRELVRDALTTGRYRELIKAGKLTTEKVKEIIASAKLEQRFKPQKLDLGTKDPKDWLLMAADGGFTLYDRKIVDVLNREGHYEWAERYIKGHALVRIIERRAGSLGIVVQFGGDTPQIKKIMMACMATFAAQEGAALYVDPEDMAFIDKAKYEVSEENMDSGYRRFAVRIKQPVDLDLLSSTDKLFRRKFDKYDEIKHGVMELGDSKFRP